MNKTYKVSDIEAILQISRTKAYELVNQGLFSIIRIGKVIRIPVEPFNNWMTSQMNQKPKPNTNDDDKDDTKAV